MLDNVNSMNLPDNTHTFNELFKKHKEPFILFAKSYVRDSMIAEDIYMESIVQYWEKRDSLPHDTNIPAYILTIVKNKALNYLRHQIVEENMLGKLESFSLKEVQMNLSSLEACNPYELFIEDIQKIVDETLSRLSENTKEVFYLSRFSNLTNKEIAQKINISEKGVEYHINRALKALKIALQDYLISIIGFLAACNIFE